MVAAQHLLLTQGLNVDHLRLLMGTSMGCMHDFVWAETYPDFAQAVMPLACLTVPIAGRNRLWRRALMDAIRTDPDWKGGEYTQEPKQALPTAADLLAWVRAHPNRFSYARPYNSGPGWTWLQGLPYILGDADPLDPVHGWDKSWAYLQALGELIDYYPSGTAAGTSTPACSASCRRTWRCSCWTARTGCRIRSSCAFQRVSRRRS